MSTPEATVDLSFAESERAIAEQQARKTLIIGVVTFALVSMACLGAAIVNLSMAILLSTWPFLTLMQVLGDFSRWQFLKRANPVDAFRDLQQPEQDIPVATEEWVLMATAGASSAADIQSAAVRRSAIVLALSVLPSMLPLLWAWIDPSVLQTTSAAGHGSRVKAMILVGLIIANLSVLAMQASRWWTLSRATPDEAVRQLQSRSERFQRRRVDSDTARFWMIVVLVVLFVLSLIFKRSLF
jgi:hypothetical protein